MTRRSVPDAKIQAASLQASRRMIARGERPAYRLRTATDGRWAITEAPWLVVARTERRNALADAILEISKWLDCDPKAIDIAVED